MAIPAAEYPLRITTMVRTTGFVEHERIRYSMPPKTIGIPGTLFLYPEKVRIVTRHGTEVQHPRYPAVGNTSYRSEDRVAKLAAVHGDPSADPGAKTGGRAEDRLACSARSSHSLRNWYERAKPLAAQPRATDLATL